MVAATVIVVAAIAFLPLVLGGDDPGEPATSGPPTHTPTSGRTPTRTPAAPPSTPVPDGTGTPDDAATTPSAAPSATPVTPGGRAATVDGSGDVVDTAGEPPPGQPGAVAAADLVEVALVADGGVLEVTFSLAGPVPGAGSHALLWSVDLYDGDERRYTVTVQQVGTRRVAGVLDWETLEQATPPDPPEVTGDSVAVRVPLDLLAELPATFTWEALGQLDGGYEDRAPEEGPAPFPDR